jgi:hypothetical protein
MNIARETLTNVSMGTKPPKHMRTRGNGKPGQKFNIDRLSDLCSKYGVDPAEVAVRGLTVGELSDKERMDVALRLMKYMYAERKSVEVSGEDGGPVEMVITWAGEK